MTDLRTIVATVLRIPVEALQDDASMEGIETWDSLAHMDLVAEIEAQFGLELSADEIVEMTTLAAIRQLLSQRGLDI